jgi:hypothetical protein
MKKLHISFDSSGWLYLFHFGVASFVRNNVKDDIDIVYSGTSSGSLCATAMSLEMDMDDTKHKIMNIHNKCDSPMSTYLNLFNETKNLLKNILPKNAHEQVRGKLYIGVTYIDENANILEENILKGHVIGSFHSKEHLLDSLHASCHIPILNQFVPIEVTSKGNTLYCYDGGFTVPMASTLIQNASDTIFINISAYPRFLFNVEVNPNVHFIKLPIDLPLTWGIVPPRKETLELIYELGYSFTNNYCGENLNDYFECKRPTNLTNLTKIIQERANFRKQKELIILFWSKIYFVNVLFVLGSFLL